MGVGVGGQGCTAAAGGSDQCLMAFVSSFPETPDTGGGVAFLLPPYRPQGCNEGSGVPLLKSTWCWLEMGESISTMGAEGGASARAA